MSASSRSPFSTDAENIQAFALLQGVDSGVVITEGQAVLFANAPAMNLFGVGSAGAAGIETLASRIKTEDREHFRGLLASGSSSDSDAVRVTVRLIRPDTVETPVRLSVATVNAGGRMLNVCTLREVAAGREAADTSSADQIILAELVNGFPGLAYRMLPGPEWRMEVVSDGCRELTGYAPEELLSGDVASYRAMIHPEDRERVARELQAAIDEGRCCQLVYRLIDAEQREKWVWEHGAGIYGDDGEVVAVEGFAVDISERKRAELSLREGQRSLATLVSNLQGMAYRCSHTRDWDMHFVSDGCFELTGYASSELLYSRSIAYGDLVHPDDHEFVLEEVERAVAGRRPFRISYRIITATGQEKLVWDQGSGVFAGEGEPTELEGFITEVGNPDRLP